MRSITVKILLALILLAGFTASANAWEKVENLPLTDEGDKRSLLLMLDRQVRYLETLPNKNQRFGSMTVSRERLLATAKALRLVVLGYHGKPEFGLRIREKFDLYHVSNPAKAGRTLFTGYYDPMIDVSPVRTEKFRYPIYKIHADLRQSSGDRVFRVVDGTMTPYYTRKQIDGDCVLSGKGYEIAWCDDYVSVYFLMVQGSGMVRFPNGTVKTVHFASSNGHPYRSAAKACMNAGKCPGGYKENLAWFRAHLSEAMPYFFTNPRYIFFTIDDREPRGVQNIPLTPLRTIATDKAHYPPGAMALVKIPMPYVTGDGKVSHRLVSMIVADGDTGSAIKGPGRVDFYYGAGKQAETLAGGTYGWGELYFLLVK